MLRLFVVLAFLCGPDVVILDWGLSVSLKRLIFLMSVCVLIALFSKSLKIRIYDVFLYVLLVISIFLRPGEKLSSVVVADLYNFMTTHIMFLLVICVLNKKPVAAEVTNRLMNYILAIMAGSFLLFILYPILIFEFKDTSGHHMTLIPFSLTSSIYRLGTITFSRLSFIFDEPGTAGNFFMLVATSLLILRNSAWLKGLSSGLFTFSLSYILWSFCMGVYNIRSMLLSKRLLPFTVGAISLIILALMSNQDVMDYFYKRISSLFTGTNNRADGNGFALEMISRNILGASDVEWNNRVISSSGIIPMIAYKGWIFVTLYITFYFRIFLALIHLKAPHKALFAYILTFMVIVLTRNNLFFASFLLMFFFILIFLGRKSNEV